jgi:hypothetical protein
VLFSFFRRSHGYARYRVIFQNDNFIFIQDIGRDKEITVKKDVKNVVENLYWQEDIRERRILYTGAKKDIGEILHIKDKFKGFKRFDKKGIEKSDPQFFFEVWQNYELLKLRCT